jgi:hypothetical protein
MPDPGADVEGQPCRHCNAPEGLPHHVYGERKCCPDCDHRPPPDVEGQQECTGPSASYCPNHGECTCPRHEDGSVQDGEAIGGHLEDGDCPLHAPDSPHPFADVEGQGREARRLALVEAMQGAWDEFVADTGCWPDCFDLHHGPGQRTRLSAHFGRGNFAEMVADRLAAAPSPSTKGGPR